MSNINKLIEHIVRHIASSLNEAMAPKIVDKLVAKFTEEAEDFNIKVTDEQLRKYIDAFDTQFKNSPKVAEKDLFKYSLADLIRLVSSKKTPMSDEEDVDLGEDIAFEDDDMVIYTGNTEERCVKYGKGEKWCIGRGNYPGYRNDAGEGYKHFYLVYIKNKDKNDPKSAYVIHVNNEGDFCYTLRPNNGDNCENTWEEIEEIFPELIGKREVFKYFPLSTKEKSMSRFTDMALSFREWSSLSYVDKKLYLVARTNSFNNSTKKDIKIFSDISNVNFSHRYLPKLDTSILDWIVETNGLPPQILLMGFDAFKPGNQRSVIKNIREENYFELNDLINEDYSWEARRRLVEWNKVSPPDSTYFALSSEGKTIIVIKITGKNNIAVDLITQNDFFRNIKLNERTEKYVLASMDNIPMPVLLEMSASKKFSIDFTRKAIALAENREDVKIEDGILYSFSNTLPSAYKVGESDLQQIPLNKEEVFQKFKENLGANPRNVSGFVESILKRMLGIVRVGLNETPYYFTIPQQIQILNIIPVANRVKDIGGNNYILFNTTQAIYGFKEADPKTCAIISPETSVKSFSENNAVEITGRVYAAYRRVSNKPFNDEEIKLKFGQSGGSLEFKRGMALEGVTMAEGSRLSITTQNDNVIIITPGGNLMVSPRTGKIIKAQSGAAMRNQAPGAGGRRGRPVGGGRAREYNNFVDGGEPIPNLLAKLQQFGLNVDDFRLRTKWNRNAQAISPDSDRGASRRNNLLDRGRVTEVYLDGDGGTIYLMRIFAHFAASVVIQPGNHHYLITSNGVTKLDSPSQMMIMLRNQNLDEVKSNKLDKLIEKVIKEQLTKK